MHAFVRPRLPKFTKRSYDFLELNYYIAYYVYDILIANIVNVNHFIDFLVNLTICTAKEANSPPARPPLKTKFPLFLDLKAN